MPRVIAAAEKAGALGAFLSGSGSTIAAVTLTRSTQSWRSHVARGKIDIARTIIITTADNDGAQIKLHQTSESNFRWVTDLKISNSSPSTSFSDAAVDFAPAILRGILYALSFIYERIVQLRLYLYRKRIFRERTLGCLVISIGNLTVGGHGQDADRRKIRARLASRRTPRRHSQPRLQRACRVPSKRSWLDRLQNKDVDPPRVVSDGKSLLLDSLTAGDEPYMLAHNLKDVIVLVDKDRVKSGLFAIDKWKVDTLLLDDGLQYLHLKHRLDIVLVDRQAPFGNEFLLPRGTLREPPRNLRRASYIFITKSTGEPNDALIERIRRYNRTAEIIECAHKPLYLQNIFTGEQLPLERLRDTFIGSICGIAAPESFEDGLRKLGARIDLAKRYIDHHRYTEAELQSFINRCIRRDLEMIVTTEKDAVRMPRLAETE